MKRPFSLALGFLSLGWLAAPATAQDGMIAPYGPGVISGADASDSDNSLSGIIGGAGVYYIKPIHDANRAYKVSQLTTTGAAGGPVVTTTTSQNIDFDPEFAWGPRFWLGYVSEDGVGVRARYWQLDEGTNMPAVNKSKENAITSAGGAFLSPTGPVFAGTGVDNLLFHNDLNVHVYDLEALIVSQNDSFTWINSLGLRYLQLDQHYDAKRRSSINTVGVFESSIDNYASHRLWAAGLTGSTEGRYAFGDSGFSAYANLRGSLVWGRDQLDNEISTRTFSPPFPPALFTTNTVSSSDLHKVLGILEGELGVQYSVQVSGLNPFLAAGVVEQAWIDPGSATFRSGVLQFFGLTLTAGLNF